MYHYWGIPSATIDWCESNYEISNYLAEFWNSISNICFMVVAVHGAVRAYQQKAELRFVVAFMWLFVIGVGSAAFHATLRYDMQLLDELPMIYASCHHLYCGWNPRSGSYNWPLLLGLIGFSGIVTWTYVVLKWPLIFQISYIFLVLIIIHNRYWNYRLIQLQEGLQGKGELALINKSLVMFAIASACWLIDYHFCDALRSARLYALETFGFFIASFILNPWLELHGWWHFFMCMAVYVEMLQNLYTRYLLGFRDTVHVKLNYIFFSNIPVIQVSRVLKKSY